MHAGVDGASENLFDLVGRALGPGPNDEFEFKRGHNGADRAQLRAGLAGFDSGDGRLPELGLLAERRLIHRQLPSVAAQGTADLLWRSCYLPYAGLLRSRNIRLKV